MGENRGGKGGEAVEAEVFHGEGGQNGAFEDPVGESGEGNFFLTGEVTGEAAGESVARARGIDNFFKRNGGGGKGSLGAREEAAVLSLFDGDVAGTPLAEPAGGAEEVGLIGELRCLGIVQNEQIDPGKKFEQAGASDIDPEVHGVGDDELGFSHLIEHEVLEVGGNVAEEDEGEFLLSGRKFRFKIGKNVELGRKGVPMVHIFFVAAVPAKSFAGGNLEPGEIDLPFLPNSAVVGGKIISHDADEADGGVKAGGESGEGGGAAEKIGAILVRGLNPIDANGADDENAHEGRASAREEGLPSRERISRAAAVGSGARRRWETRQTRLAPNWAAWATRSGFKPPRQKKGRVTWPQISWILAGPMGR